MAKIHILLDNDDTLVRTHNLTNTGRPVAQFNTGLIDALAKLGLTDVSIVTTYKMDQISYAAYSNILRIDVIDKLESNNIHVAHLITGASPQIEQKDKLPFGGYFENVIKPMEQEAKNNVANLSNEDDVLPKAADIYKKEGAQELVHRDNNANKSADPSSEKNHLIDYYLKNQVDGTSLTIMFDDKPKIVDDVNHFQVGDASKQLRGVQLDETTFQKQDANVYMKQILDQVYSVANPMDRKQLQMELNKNATEEGKNFINDYAQQQLNNFPNKSPLLKLAEQTLKHAGYSYSEKDGYSKQQPSFLQKFVRKGDEGSNKEAQKAYQEKHQQLDLLKDLVNGEKQQTRLTNPEQLTQSLQKISNAAQQFNIENKSPLKSKTSKMIDEGLKKIEAKPAVVDLPQLK